MGGSPAGRAGGATLAGVRARGPRSFWPRPRVRRPVDAARLALAAAVLAALVAAAFLDAGLVASAARLIPAALTGLPRAVLSVANVAASLAVLGTLVAIVVDTLRTRRFAFTSAVLACGLGLLLGGLVRLGVAVGTDDRVGVLLGPPDDSAGLPVVAAVALAVGADLRGRRWSAPSRLALAAAVVCDLGLGSLTVPRAAFAVLLGTTAGLGVRVALGVLPARPPEEQLRSVLERAGWPVAALRPVREAAGQIRYAGTGPDGDDLRVTVVDPDRRGVPFARRAWRLLRFRRAAVGRPALSLRGQLERQALTEALVQSTGVPAPRLLALLAAGRALLLVERPLIGTPLPAAPQGAPAAAAALRRLHDVGLAHGAVTADGLLVLPDGRAGFAGLAAAQPAATELQRELDVVALLVATGSVAGAAAAVAALRTGYGTTPAAESRLAALLQPLALPRSVRRRIRGTPLLADLRTALVGATSGGAVAVPRLERLRPRTVVSVAAATLAAHILATQLSQVSLGSALAQARPSWLVVALLGSAVTYVGAAGTLRAFAPVPLPLARTAFVQLAASFVSLVTPPTVGQVGMNIRFLQRSGVPATAAAATVAVKEAVTIPVTVLLLLLCGWLSGVSTSRLTLLPSGDVLAVLAAAAAVLALVAAAPPTRRLIRDRVEPVLRRTLPLVLQTFTRPRRLGEGVAGVLVLNAGYVVALDASLRAFATSLALPALVVVYLAAATLGSAAPTPGGLGAVEAALVGGLTATGVPVAAALTAVLAYRTVTFWLPACAGWLAFTALQRRQRI